MHLLHNDTHLELHSLVWHIKEPETRYNRGQSLILYCHASSMLIDHCHSTQCEINLFTLVQYSEFFFGIFPEEYYIHRACRLNWALCLFDHRYN